MTGHTLNIETLFPTDHENIWTAEFKLVSPDEFINEIDVAHVTRIRVRFAYDDNGSTAGLLDAAYAKARVELEKVAHAMASQPLTDFRQQARDRNAELNKPFELDTSGFDIPGL